MSRLPHVLRLASSSSRMTALRSAPVLRSAVAGSSSVRTATNFHYVRSASSAATFTSSLPNAPPIPANPTVSVHPPSLDKIKEEGFFDDDVKLVAPELAKLVITPEAIRQLAILAANEPPDSTLALRVGVDSGGCHGYQYIMELTEEKGVDDYVFKPDGVAAIPVYVDLMSLGLLKGATLHYATELIGSSFRLQDNPQAKDGGNCGCGVSWEAKDIII